MALQIQLDFLESTDEIDVLHREFDALQELVDRLRKGLFARHDKLNSSINELLNMYIKQQKEIEELKALLTKEKNYAASIIDFASDGDVKLCRSK